MILSRIRSSAMTDTEEVNTRPLISSRQNLNKFDMTSPFKSMMNQIWLFAFYPYQNFKVKDVTVRLFFPVL